jgi:osmoprotectant transport system substrate-binding protein
MRRLGLVRGLALPVFAMVLAACGPPAARAPHGAGGSPGVIVVGVSGAFTENQIVAEMYAQVLEHAGYRVQRQFDLPSREVSQQALEAGQIDLKPEYLSSLLLYLDPSARASSNAGDVVGADRRLLQPKGITMLTPSEADDTNEFVANAETARRYHLTTMSSLAPVAGRLVFGGSPECAQRPLCLMGLHRIYGILFDVFKPLDVGGPETVAALKSNQVQIGLLFSTDPRIEENGFVPLTDDKHLQNAENITPVIRTDMLNDRIRGLLDAVSARLTTPDMTSLVGQVTIDGHSVPEVARAYLTANGLL